MKYSIYNYIFRSEKYGFLLYNSETNAFLKLSESMYNSLKGIKDGQVAIESLDKEVISAFSNAKIFVSDDDNFILKKKFRRYMNSFMNKSLGLAIAPTTFCNFKCPYCYEENRASVYMKDETVDNLISFMKKKSPDGSVYITWYGGEPLAAFGIIKKIMEQISNDKEIRLLNHSIITNGYLLDEEKCIYFSEHPLTHIQITIDGLKESHDKRRILLNGAPTYEKILSNIDTFFKYNTQCEVTIRVNIDTTNVDDYYYLYKSLSERWRDNRLFVYPAFVRDYTQSCASTCGSNLLDRKKRVEFYTELADKYGVNVGFYPEHHVGGCGATNVNYYVVGPEGELYKCWNDIGLKNRIVGYLDSDEVPNQDVLIRYMVGPSMFEDPACQTCNLFPVCDGGCQWLRLKNVYEGGGFDLCTNRKGNLELFLEKHYAQRINSGEWEKV